MGERWEGSQSELTLIENMNDHRKTNVAQFCVAEASDRIRVEWQMPEAQGRGNWGATTSRVPDKQDEALENCCTALYLQSSIMYTYKFKKRDLMLCSYHNKIKRYMKVNFRGMMSERLKSCFLQGLGLSSKSWLGNQLFV